MAQDTVQQPGLYQYLTWSSYSGLFWLCVMRILLRAIYRKRLRMDVKKWGSKLTDRQSQEISVRRKAILEQYDAHQSSALRFIPEELIDDQPTTVCNGQPESLPLLLPSSLAKEVFTTESMKALRDTEITLRRTACLKALHTIRSLAVSRVQLLRSKQLHTRSVANTTRSETYLQRLTDRQRHAVWLY